MPDSPNAGKSTRYQSELDLAVAAARAAADLVMEMRPTASYALKADGSIVTSADLAASELICDRIRRSFPNDAILTEEATDNPDRLKNERCWLIDPIDGTQQFADGEAEFDVYIALADRGRVVLGVAINPPTGLLVSAIAAGGAFVTSEGRTERFTFSESASVPVLASRPWLGVPENMPALERAADAVDGSIRDVSRSLSVRSLLPGSDQVNAVVALYLDEREPESCEWDLAVLDIVVREAGGRSSDLNGNPLVFNKPDPRFPDGLIMATIPALFDTLRRELRA